jgi:hypothetical protein
MKFFVFLRLLIKSALIGLITFIALFSITGFALADFGVNIPNPLCLGGTSSTPCINDFPTLITTITGYILTVVGALAVVMIVYAGFLFLTSSGSPEKIGKAKQALIYALWGVAISLAGTGLISVIKAVLGI